MLNRGKLLVVLLLSALFSFQMGCSSGGGGGGGDSSGGGTGIVDAVSVQSGSKAIVADGSAQTRITVTATDTSGESMKSGAVVTITSTAGDLDSSKDGVQSSINVAMQDGAATAMLTSPTNTGSAKVTASVDGVNDTVTVDFVAASASQIELTASPNNLTADGDSTSIISATVTDAMGNAVADGETISFSITGPGTISLPSARTVNGVAAITYTASTQTGIAEITAESTSGTVVSTTRISLIRATVGSVSVSSGSNSIVANGVSKALIRANIVDMANNPVEDGTPVNFSATAGTLDATKQGGSSEVTTFTVNGTATATLTSTKNVGTSTVTVTAGGVSSTVTVNFVSGNTTKISVSASPVNLTADGVSTSAIRATVTDENGNPSQNGEIISFAITSGEGSLNSPTASTFNGAATVSYTAGSKVGNVVIEAKAANGVSSSVQISLIRAPIGSLVLRTGADEIVADGSSQMTVFATVKDGNGNPAPEGTTVTFSTSAGRLSASGRAGTVNGVARVTLTSSANIGRVTITATAGGYTDSVDVNFVAGSPRRISLTSVPDRLTADGVSQANLRAEVTDVNGNPVANGELISFFIESGGGRIGPPLTAQTSGGVANVVFTAPNSSGTTTVVAEATTGNRGRTQIDLVMPDIGSIVVQADPASVIADGSTSTILATVRYVNGNPVEDGTSIEFETTGGTFQGGGNFTTAATSGGVASVVLVSSSIPETATVTASRGTVAGQTQVEFTAIPGFLALTLSQTSVKSDNSNAAMITATVLDANRVPVEDITVAFKTSVEGAVVDTGGGQISATTAVTDSNGAAQVEFRSGTVEKKNQTVTIEAWIPAFPQVSPKLIPIQIVGTTISLSTANTNLEIDPANPDRASSQLTITVKDAGEVPINNAPVTLQQLNVGGLGQGEVTITPASGETNVNGVFIATVTGVVEGDVTVLAESLGAQASQNFTVGTVGEVFGIIEPLEDPVSLSTNDPLTIRVKAPNSSQVRFATSLGGFGGIKNIVVNVVGGVAEATLQASEPGVATVEVMDINDPDVKDTLTVVVSAPSDEAAQISLQASATVVAPSTPTIKNTVTLTVTVKNTSDQVVGGAPVALSILNPTGGGESISPVIVYTNEFGVATSTFTSGSLSTAATGVIIQAELIRDPAVTDSVEITIGGTAVSIEFGRGTTVESIQSDTLYSLPMSVMVTDSNGNPVSGAVVTLGAWPAFYTVGYFREIDDGKCVPVYYPSYSFSSSPIWYPNEDDPGRNLILDPGEDVNFDGQLTPPSSSAGTLPPTVTTGSNGSAEFTLTYLKSSAAWIQDEISATTLVFGTETQTRKVFTLPWLRGEECSLPASPYDAPGGVRAPALSAFSYPADEGSPSNENIEKIVAEDSNPQMTASEDAVLMQMGDTVPEENSTTGVILSDPSDTIADENAVKPISSKFVAASVDAVNTKNVPSAVDLSVQMDQIETNATTLVKAAVYDVRGKGIAGVPVIFILDDPSKAIMEGGAVTDVAGEAAVELTARDLAGEVKISAIAGSVSNDRPEVVSIIDPSAPAFINLQTNPTSVVLHGETAVTAQVLDSDGALAPAWTPVTFRVEDALLGEITKSSVTNSGGVATAAFQAGGEPGATLIEASSGKASATVNISVNRTAATALEFVSATPQVINVKGSGGVEASTIRFMVSDGAGRPLEGVRVHMTKTGPDGGEMIDPSGDGTPDDATVVSGKDGIASVLLKSGSAGGPVRVRAVLDGQGASIAAESSVVSIEGGTPSANYFDVSAGALNLPGLSFENQKADITVGFADRFGIADALEGAVVSFVSEPGLQLESAEAALGDDGTVSVAAKTRQPLEGVTAPEDVLPQAWEIALRDYVNSTYGTGFTENVNPRDGLCSVLVYARGEESFTDANGNGLFDTGEAWHDQSDDPFVDYNGNAVRDSGSGDPEEPFIDGTLSVGVWDGLNGSWDDRKLVFDNLEFLLTGAPIIAFDSPSFSVKNDGQPAIIKVLICDRNMNPLSAGTKVEITTDEGVIQGRTRYEYPDGNVIGPDAAAHKNLIEYVVVISDDSDAIDEERPAQLTVTIEWEGAVYRAKLKGVIDAP